jgi:monoamine oxidase
MGHVVRIVVVGCGLSGLRAADLLVGRGHEVVALEAATRIGGRLLRQQVAGVGVDGGGAWVGPGQDRVLALVESLGLRTAPTYARGRTRAVLRGVVRDRSGWLPPVPPGALVDLGQAMARIDLTARRLPRHAGHLDSQTVADWLDRHVHTHGARAMLTIASGAVTGAPADEVSMLTFLTDVRHAGSLLRLTGTEGGAQDARIAGQAVTLCERLAGRLGDRVRLEAQVVALRQGTGGVEVVLGDGQRLHADHVVVATDPVVAGRIDLGAALPEDRQRWHARSRQGSGIKVHVAYAEPFWRRRGLSGDLLCDEGLVRVAFDATPLDDGPGVLVVFLGGLGAHDETADPALAALLEPGATAPRRERVVADLARILGDDALAPLDYVEQDWRTEPFLAGCVPAPAPGLLTSVPDDLHRPWGRVHWAGTESADRWAGYMEGAVRAAERVVAEIDAASDAPAG